MYPKVAAVLVVVILAILIHVELPTPILITRQRVLLTKPINSVFDFVTKLENIGEWYPTFHKVKAIDPKSKNHVGKLYRDSSTSYIPFLGSGTIQVIADNAPNFFSFIADKWYLPLYELSLESDTNPTHTDTWLVVKILSRRQSYAFKYTLAPLLRIWSSMHLQQSLFTMKMLFRES